MLLAKSSIFKLLFYYNRTFYYYHFYHLLTIVNFINIYFPMINPSYYLRLVSTETKDPREFST